MVAARVLGPERLTAARSELLGQRDDDARWAADVAEPVARRRARRFRALAAQRRSGPALGAGTLTALR